MHIWLIKDGEKYGPHPDFHIRQGIENGQYDADTPAWHEGLDEWTTLGEMSLFKSTLEEPAAPKDPPHEKTPYARPVASVEPSDSSAIPAPENLYLLRRFWARWLDLQLYIAIWWLFLYYTNADVGAIFSNPWILLVQLLPWVPIEAMFIHYHGTTPGKWLLGIRVINNDDSALTGRQSSWRSLRVLIAGVGLGWGLISPICQALSYWLTRRIGRTIWDHMGGHKVEFTPIRGTRYLAVIGLIYISLQLQFAILAPYVVPMYQEQFPALKEHFEKNPPRHFPERHKAPVR
jgi:uncharacterized RDD family membrane protein YckC